MTCKVVFYFAVVLVALALLSGGVCASSYRKAPFNGSIFGKRGSIGASVDAESRMVAIPALCEVALEACSTWMSAVARDTK